MDPNNQNPQVDNAAVNKLEQDLQNLKQETPVTPQQPVTVEQSVPLSPFVLEVPPVAPVEPLPPASAVEANIPAPETPKKGSPMMIIAIILALVAVLAVVAYVFGAKLFTPTPKQVACTQEAKICPDGTSVGRVGPNCEFATCPSPTATTDPTANWKTYTGKAYSFKYPVDYVIRESDVFGTNISLSNGSGVFLSVYPLETLTYQNFNICTASVTKGCLVSFNSQTNPIQDILLSGKKAKSFYSTVNGTGDIYHSVEIIDSPTTGLRASIEISEQDKSNAAAKDNIFNQILSTFKFTEATPAASPTASPSSTPTATP